MKSPLLISTLLFLLCTFGANPTQAGLIKRQECDPEAGCKVNFTPPPAVIANAIPAGAPKLIKRQAEECDPEAGCKRPEEYDPPPAIIAKAVDAAPLDQLPEVQSAAEELPLETELIGLVKKLMRRHTTRLARRDPQYYQPKQQQQPPLQPAQPAQCPAPPAQQQPKANEPQPKANEPQPKANQPPKQTAPMPPKNNNNMPEQKKQEQPKVDNKMPEQKKQEQPKADNKMPEQKKQEQPDNVYQPPNQEAPKQQAPPMKNNQPPKQQVPPMKDNQPPQQPQPKDAKEQPKQKAPEQPQGVYQPPPPPAKKEDQKAQVDPKKEDPKKADPKQAVDPKKVVDPKQPGQKAGDAKGGDVKGAKQDSLQIFNTFCDNAGLGKALGDGTQKKTPTCSRTIQGAIPSFDRMVSTIITSPNAGATVPAKKALKVEVRTNNLDLGFFEDPNARYYQTPQTLNGQGIIEGHQHITVQRLTGVGQNVNAPPDARTEALAFFKGLDDDSQNGILSVEIPAENLAQPGIYRLCTITGTRGHQPVLMPVARRGSQDDCIRITVQ